MQGLEQAGDTLAPEIILEPSLSAAIRVAESPWGAPEQQVRLVAEHVMPPHSTRPLDCSIANPPSDFLNIINSLHIPQIS